STLSPDTFPHPPSSTVFPYTTLFRSEVAGGKDAAGHGHEMGHERDCRTVQLLDDLRQMPMTFDRIRMKRFVHLAEVRAKADRPACAADARLGVDDDVRPNQPGRDGGRESEDGSGRVAAWDCDEPGFGQLGAMQLRKSEDRLLEQCWIGVWLAVPLWVQRLVVQPEVGAHVDHPHAGIQPCPDLRRPNVVR